jgi:DNA-binding SARP family transcriptional activator
MAFLRLFWLGPPVIEPDGKSLRLERRKILALLAYLSLSPYHPARETLASPFWSEYDQQYAMANLRHSFFSLASSLPPDLIEVDRDTSCCALPGELL